MQMELTKVPMLINQPSIIRSMCYFSDKGEAQKDFTKKILKIAYYAAARFQCNDID